MGDRPQPAADTREPVEGGRPVSPPAPAEHELVQIFPEVLPAQTAMYAHGPSLQL